MELILKTGKIPLAHLCKRVHSLHMQTEQHITKNESGKFEAFHRGILVAEVDTLEEAELALVEELEQEKEFTEVNGIDE